MWSDGVERPDWYDGTAFDRAIEEYFDKPVRGEIERLKRENAEMRARLKAERLAASKTRGD